MIASGWMVLRSPPSTWSLNKACAVLDRNTGLNANMFGNSLPWNRNYGLKLGDKSYEDLALLMQPPALQMSTDLEIAAVDEPEAFQARGCDMRLPSYAFVYLFVCVCTL